MKVNRFSILGLGSMLAMTLCLSCNADQNSKDKAQGSDGTIVVDGSDSEYQQIKAQRRAESKELQANREKLEAAMARVNELEAKEEAERQKKNEALDEGNHPEKYLELKTETARTERLFTTKFELNGQLRSKAKHGYYENVIIEVSYYSKNNVLVGTEEIRVNAMIESDYKAFSKRIKPVRRADHYDCKILLADYNKYEDYNIRY